MTTRKKRIDIEQQVTDQLIAQLEAGTGQWKKSWATLGGDLPTRFTGQHYKGINLFILAMQGRGNAHWFTYKQAKSVGGQVRSGEKGTTVVFFKPFETKDKETGKDITIPLMRAYTVFNAEQIDGLPEKYFPVIDPDAMNTDARCADVDAYIKATGAKIDHGGDSAYYVPLQHRIQLPNYNQFQDAVAYHGTALHELGHWTKGATDKIDRSKLSYGEEELVAEIFASMTAAKLGIESEVREDHAQYLASWLKIIKADKRAIFRAARDAQKAVDYTDSLQPVAAKAAA
jgi:antirestriction protein ArdC